jgi:hypothetical protein
MFAVSFLAKKNAWAKMENTKLVWLYDTASDEVSFAVTDALKLSHGDLYTRWSAGKGSKEGTQEL